MYVYDTSIFINLFRYYYRSRFPSLWDNFENLITNGSIISTRENLREIKVQDDTISGWASKNVTIFQAPSIDETEFIKGIFEVPHFRQIIEQQKLLSGGLNADPFIIAKAATIDGHVVTAEIHKPNAAKIPNICEHFSIPCLDFEQFMGKEGWSF
jgi:uncharacterized protein DUF4411